MPSKKDSILNHLRANLGKWVHNQELRDITGLNDVPRTVRALRQEGWQIEVDGRGNNRLASPEKREARGDRKAVSEKLRYEVLARDGFRCRSCGRSAANGITLQVDHIVPVDWGGQTELGNLQTLCEACNRGKKAWTDAKPAEAMKIIMEKPTVEGRIEALFDMFPNQDIPSLVIQQVSRGAFDWQRALRRIRQQTGKMILPSKDRRAYRYHE